MADKLLKSIKFPTLPDRYVIGDTSLTEEGAAAEAKAVGEALATKADTKGRYEDLIVGGAEQLMADEYETDKEPYLFRHTGGSADVGNREYLDKIVGGTVGWNQLAISTGYNTETINGITFTKNDDGTWTINGTATANAIKGIGYTAPNMVSGHKYLVGSSVWASAQYGVAANSYYYYRDAPYWMYNIPLNIVAYVTEGTTVNNVVLKPQLIDLTAMFGTTIADAIYAMEQATAGAGVAWFRNYFPKDYYPYDSGTLRSVEGVSAHETVGNNLLDAKPYSGAGYNLANGTDVNLAESSIAITQNDNGFSYEIVSGWQMVNFKTAPLKAGTYHVQIGGTVSESRTSVYVIGTDGKTKGSAYNATGVTAISTTKTLLEGEYILVASGLTTVGTQVLISPQIELGTTATAYEPYQKHTYPLDSSLTLRGVPKLVDGKLAFDGDVYQPSGEVQRRYGIVDLGTLDWDKQTLGGGSINFRAIISDFKAIPDSVVANIICDRYSPVSASVISSSTTLPPDKTIASRSSEIQGIRIYDTTYSDATADAFKSAMSGVYFVYELATPTTETADGYEQYQRCDPSGTEEFVTTGIVPVGHETRYPHDLKKKIETAPDSPSTDGTYLMKRSGGKNTYMALPSTPSANGAYVLTVTVSGGSASYSWAAKE